MEPMCSSSPPSIPFFLVVSPRSQALLPVASIWGIKASPLVLAFGWLAFMGAIFTLDNLLTCKVMTVNACPLRLKDTKSVDHLLNCRAA